MVIAVLARWFWLIVCLVSIPSSHSGPSLMPRSPHESCHLWSQERNPVSLARMHVAWRPGNHTELDTPKIRACPLAGWQGSEVCTSHHLLSVPVDIRLGTQYCIRQRRHDHRSSEVPHLSKRWVDHPEPSRALHQLACDVSERQLSRAAASPAAPPPFSGHFPLPWPATIERRTDGCGPYHLGSLAG